MAITSEYSGGYEVKNIISKAVYNTQTIITDSFQIVPEDKKSIYSLYFLEGYKTAIKLSYCLSSDNTSFSDFQEVINTSTLGNYILFCTNTDVTGYIKFKIEITGSAVMEFNQLGVLKGVRTRSFLLLEGANEHKTYQCAENIQVGSPVKLVSISGSLKLAKLAGNSIRSEVELYNSGALPQIEILGNTVIACYREYSTNMLMLKSGTVGNDNYISWNSAVQVYSTALQVTSQIRTFSVKKLTESKFVIGFVCSGGSAYVIGGDVINGVPSLGAAVSAGTVSTSNPFCNIIRLTDEKFLLCSFTSGVHYPQYRCVIVTQANAFTFGTNFSPLSSTAIAITCSVINANDAAGILFAVGISLSTGVWLYSNYISGASNIVSEAGVNISSSTCAIAEFSIETYNTSRGMLSYTIDDATHKLTVRYFNISKSSVTLSDQAASSFDAVSCASKILPLGKIVHVYAYYGTSKLYCVVSDFTSAGLTWGIPFELMTGISSCSFMVKGIVGNRYIILYTNETTHSIKYRIFEDDRGLFIGMMNETCNAGDFGEVKVIGQTYNKLSSLMPGEQHFIQADGLISNLVTNYAAGIAISDKDLLIRR